MTRSKRLPSNAVTSMVETMAAALAGDIEPPAHVRLRDGDRPYWTAIVRARARKEWTDADLVHAGNMARAMADIERIAVELEAEGDVIENARGTPVMNPKHQVLEMLSRRVMALSRLMQMQSYAGGDLEDKVKARRNEAAARQTAGQVVGEDDLIPTG